MQCYDSGSQVLNLFASEWREQVFGVQLQSAIVDIAARRVRANCDGQDFVHATICGAVN